MYFKAFYGLSYRGRFATLVYDSRLDDLAVYNAVVTQELDASGSFTMTMPPEHPFYNKFAAINQDCITVEEYSEDNEWIDSIFGGILSEINVDFVGNKTLTFYGYSIMLHNTYGFNGDVSYESATAIQTNLDYQMLRCYGSIANNYIFRFTGTIASWSVPGEFYIGQESVYDALMRIKSAFFPDMPLHYKTKFDNESQSITRGRFTSDFFLGDWSEISTQVIECGKNLLDYSVETLDGDFATGVIGYGAETDVEHYGVKERVCVRYQNPSNIDYIFWNDYLVDLYGEKVMVKIWDDITTTSELESKCRSFISDMRLKRTLSCKAFDLSKVSNVDRFEIGEVVYVIPNPRAQTEVFVITKIERNLTDPMQDNLTMKNYW